MNKKDFSAYILSGSHRNMHKFTALSINLFFKQVIPSLVFDNDEYLVYLSQGSRSSRTLATITTIPTLSVANPVDWSFLAVMRQAAVHPRRIALVTRYPHLFLSLILLEGSSFWLSMT